MKAHQFLFLFGFIMGLIYPPLKAQNSKDSTAFYYDNIINPINSKDIPSAIQFYNSQKNKHLQDNEIYDAIVDLRMVAIGQLHLGESNESEQTVVEALRLIDASLQSDTLIEARKGLYNQLGKIYRSTYNYSKALSAYNNTLKYSHTQSDSITVLNNKATIYKDAGNYSKAYEELMIALQKRNIQKNEKAYAMVLNNLGYIQTRLNDPEALSNLKKALLIRKRLNYLPGMYSSYHDFAEYYIDRNDKSNALKYANKAYTVAKTLNSISYLEDALSLFVIMNDNPKIVTYKIIRDSLEKERQLAQNKYAFIRYNVEKEKKKTAEAELGREKEKSQKTFYLLLVIGVALVAIIIYIYLRERHKREKLLQVHKTEARISKKVHDDVANDIYQLMTKMQRKYKDEEALLDDLENIYNKTRDISKENSAFEIGGDFNEQLNELLLTYQSDTTAISTRNLATLDWEIISKIKKETVYKVLRELMTNMKKYSKASAVLLTFHQRGKNIIIEYSDNGQGCTLKNKNGLQNAENRIQAIKGTIIFESEPGNGFRSKISI